MKKVYRLGPPLSPRFHRDPLGKLAKEVFKDGGFYAVGRRHLGDLWRTMSEDFAFRPLYEITLCEDAKVVFYSGFQREEKIANDLTEVRMTDYTFDLGLYDSGTEGLRIDLEGSQLVVRLTDIVSVKEIDKGYRRPHIHRFSRRTGK